MGMMGLVMAFSMLFGAGGNDALDFVSSKIYWELKGVPMTVEAVSAELKPADASEAAAVVKDLASADADRQAAAAAKLRGMGPAALAALERAAMTASQEMVGRYQGLIDEITEDDKTSALRRLMAMRTLGELKATGAVGLLKGYLTSAEPFEAEYARAAIAAIEGKPFARPAPKAAARVKDAWAMPESCGVVGQVSLAGGKAVDVTKILKSLPAMMLSEGTDAMARQMTEQILSVIERTGNIRIDTLTMGVSAEVDEENGFAVFVARGLYNAEKVRDIIRAEQLKSHRVGGVEVFALDSEVALAFPSNNVCVFMPAAAPDDGRMGRLLDALKTGKACLSAEGDLGRLIKGVDAAGPVWAAMVVSDSYREAPLLAGMKTLTLTSRQDKGVTDLTLNAEGLDADATTAAVEQLTSLLQEACGAIGPLVGNYPMLKPLSEFLKSVKVDDDDVKVVVKAKVAGHPASLVTSAYAVMLVSVMERMNNRGGF